MIYDYPTAFWSWGPEEQEAIARVLASGQFTAAHEVEAFEHDLAAYHGRKHAVFVNSGSSANLIMVAALFHLEDRPLQRGDKAVVPAIAWATTYAPLVQYGLDLVVMDVDAGWNADATSIDQAADLHGARLVVGCSILGNPAPLDKISPASGAYFINDDCESLGARIAGRTTGSYGLMASSSFYISHQIAAIEGGAVLTDDDECARLCRMLRNHGWSKGVDQKPGFANEYDFRYFGFNVRGLELHAALARVQLAKVEGFIAERRRNVALWRDLVAGLPLEHPHFQGEPSPFGLHFGVETEEIRERLVLALRAAGVDCRLPTGGSFRKHVYGAAWAAQQTPRADAIHERGLFLGCAPYPIDAKIERAASVVRKILGG